MRSSHDILSKVELIMDNVKMKEDGFLFKILPSYEVTVDEVSDFDRNTLSRADVFISRNEADDNPHSFVMDGKHLAISNQIRINVLEDLRKLGYEKGCAMPENAYYLIAGQPSVTTSPESLYYEIEKTFEDISWEFTGCPHHPDNLLKL